MMTTRGGFEIRVFGCDIHLAAACPETRAILERYVFPSLPRLIRSGNTPHLSIRLIRASDQFQLLVGDAVVASASAAVDLVPEITHVLDDAVIEQLTQMRAIHAGTVLWNGRALLLPGATQSGKSSLVAELLKRGATYFSDEYALIDPFGLVYPYPRPLLLRNGSPEQHPALPSEWNAPVGDAPAPVGWIQALEFQPSYAWRVTPISQSEALLVLLKNTPHLLAESPDLVQVFRRAVAGASCYVGRRPDAPHAADHILQLLTARP